MKPKISGSGHIGANGNRALRVLDAVDANIAVLDSEGCIVSTNKGWRSFSASNCHLDGSLPRQVAVGANYLKVCSEAVGESSENAMRVFEGIRAVITEMQTIDGTMAAKRLSIAGDFPLMR